MNRKLARNVRRIIVALVLFIIWAVLASVAARSLIVRAPIPEADAMVVLSGSAAYRERTHLAAKLFQDGRAARVILTNDNQRGPWSASGQRNPFYHELALNELLTAGVPRERIDVREQIVSSTYEEALVLRDYMKSHGFHTLLIVTSAYHSRRALWTFVHVFNNEGMQIGLEPVQPGFETPSSETWWLFPAGWRMVLGEYVKIIAYRLQYREAISRAAYDNPNY